MNDFDGDSWEAARLLWDTGGSDDVMEMDLDDRDQEEEVRLWQDPDEAYYFPDEDSGDDYYRKEPYTPPYWQAYDTDWDAPAKPGSDVFVDPDPRDEYVWVEPGQRAEKMEESDDDDFTLSLDNSPQTSPRQMDLDSPPTPRLQDKGRPGNGAGGDGTPPSSPRFLGQQIQEMWREQIPPAWKINGDVTLTLESLGIERRWKPEAWKAVEFETVVLSETQRYDYDRGRTVIVLCSVYVDQYDREWEYGLGIFALRLASELFAQESLVIMSAVNDTVDALRDAKTKEDRRNVMADWFTIRDDGSSVLDTFRSNRKGETGFVLFIVGSGSLKDETNAARVDYILKTERQRSADRVGRK